MESALNTSKKKKFEVSIQLLPTQLLLTLKIKISKISKNRLAYNNLTVSSFQQIKWTKILVVSDRTGSTVWNQIMTRSLWEMSLIISHKQILRSYLKSLLLFLTASRMINIKYLKSSLNLSSSQSWGSIRIMQHPIESLLLRSITQSFPIKDDLLYKIWRLLPSRYNN